MAYPIIRKLNSRDTIDENPSKFVWNLVDQPDQKPPNQNLDSMRETNTT